MHVWGSLLIVAAAVAAPIDSGVSTEPRFPGAVTAFRGNFEEDSDDDFDGWPLGWNRLHGPQYPHYLRLHLSQEPSASGKQCFRFDLDGGAAAVASPPIPYDVGSEYLVEAAIKTVALKHDEAYVALKFLDAKGRTVQTNRTARLRSDEWRRVRIGPTFCDLPEVRQLVVELHLEPGDAHDLRGAALFDDVWIGKLPRKSVRGSRPFNVFQARDKIELSVTLTGVTAGEIRGELQLFDRLGTPLSTEQRTSLLPLDVDPATTPRTMTWQPKLADPGFYRGKVTVHGPAGVLREDETSLVIVDSIERLRSGPGSLLGDFGWSISDPSIVPNHDDLHLLLYESAARRVKYPVWFASADSPEAFNMMRFVERMNVQGVSVIGTLTPRPPSADGRDDDSEIAAAQTFRDPPARWMPIVETTMFDLAFKVGGWQLGNDHDLGFLALPGALNRIADVKKEFDRIEQDSQVGVPWSWLQELPSSGSTPLRFISLTTSPELTAAELGAMLDGANLPQGVQPWIGISGLPRQQYSTTDRVRDLVDRMTAAKVHGAGAVFFVDPFEGEHGLLERSGSPTELFLPWRAVASVLDGAAPIGSVVLPGHSRNQIFLRSDDAVMILSRDEAGSETLALGGEPKAVDLWERTQPLEAAHDGTKVSVGPSPIIITGIHRKTAAWEQAFKMEPKQLKEVFGLPQPTTLVLRNTFDGPVQGKVTVVAPPDWTVRPDAFDVSLGSGEEVRLPLEITLPPGVETRTAAFRIDHDLAADIRRQFSVFRELQIGDGEVILEVDTRLVGDVLEVEQRLINNSGKSVSFRFNLFAPDQRRMRAQVIDLPPGVDVQVYRVPNGANLKGRTLWIRAEEIGGSRILSERFTVGDDS